MSLFFKKSMLVDITKSCTQEGKLLLTLGNQCVSNDVPNFLEHFAQLLFSISVYNIQVVSWVVREWIFSDWVGHQERWREVLSWTLKDVTALALGDTSYFHSAPQHTHAALFKGFIWVKNINPFLSKVQKQMFRSDLGYFFLRFTWVIEKLKAIFDFVVVSIFLFPKMKAKKNRECYYLRS